MLELNQQFSFTLLSYQSNAIILKKKFHDSSTSQEYTYDVIFNKHIMCLRQSQMDKENGGIIF